LLEKLANTFGMEIKMTALPFDPGKAAALGVPLSGKSSREELALIAFLMGPRDHYPTFYQSDIETPLSETEAILFR